MRRLFFLVLIILVPLIANSQCPDGWQHLNPGNYYIRDIYAFNDSTVYMAGTGYLLTTQNGGTKWSSSKTFTVRQNFWDAIDFISQDKGWAAGGNARPFSNGILYELDKKDTGWQVQKHSPSGEAFTSITFIDSNKGWAISPSALFQTTDGGQSWHKQKKASTGQAFLASHFEGQDKGWIAGADGLILHTINGGQEWQKQNAFTNFHLWDFHFENTKQGWVVGDSGTIGYTPDGGESWFPQSSPSEQNLNEVHFIDTNRGWIVGENGTLLHTVDGGETWQKQTFPANEKLNTVHFSSDSIGWIGGDDGALFKYTASKPKTSFEYTIHGNTVQFHNTSIPNSNFRWHFGNDSTSRAKNPSHTYKQNSVYEVCLIGENNCGTDTSCRSIQIVQTGKQEQINPFSTLSVYPNPVSQEATLQYHLRQPKKVTLTLYNSEGQRLKTHKWQHKSTGFHSQQIIMQDLPNGLYYYRLKTGGFQKEGKLVKTDGHQ